MEAVMAEMAVAAGAAADQLLLQEMAERAEKGEMELLAARAEPR